MGKRAARLAFVVMVLILSGLASGAVYFQLAQPAKGIVLVLIVAIAFITLAMGPRRGWLIMMPAALIGAVVYGSIKPRNDRIWEFDVARGVTGLVQGDQVHLHNLRDFDWITPTSAHEAWRDVTVDLGHITSLDLVTSVWSSPLIAHTLVSFGFSDGQHVVFSAEIRREKGEKFSSIGGFFRQFELVMIAATEEDIIRLRTNIRREDVALYPLNVTPEQARELFLRYIDRANKLADQPEFYNTLTSNCTTIIFDLARAVDGRLPFDWRVLASGKLASYLHDLGLLAPTLPMDEISQNARISRLAQQAEPQGTPFSKLIRQEGVAKLQPKG